MAALNTHSIVNSIVTQPSSFSFKEKNDPIFERTTLIGTVFSLALTAVLITLTILTSKNMLPLNLPALQTSVGVLGGSQVIGLPLLLIHGWNEKQLRKQNRRLYLPPKHPEFTVNIPKALPPPSSLTGVKKAEEPSKKTVLEFKAFNLERPDQPLVEPSMTQLGFCPLPIFGTYHLDNPNYSSDLSLMTVRLSPNQLNQFPEGLVNWVNCALTEKSVEGFFMVFDNRSLSKRRNIALHGIAIPDKKASGVWASKSDAGGFKKKINIRMYEPIGINSHNGTGAIPIGNQGKGNMILHIHDGRYSPNNCSFDIDSTSEVASTYFAIKMVDKVVLIHALFLNRESGEGQKLVQALGQPTLDKFLTTLQTSQFTQYAQVQKTLQKPKK